MKLKNKIQMGLANSYKYCISTNLLLLKEKKHISFYDNNLEKINFINIDNDINSIQVKNNKVLILDEYNKPFLYEIGTNIKRQEILLDEQEHFLWESFPTFDKFIVEKKIGKFNYTLGIYYPDTKSSIYFNDNFGARKILNNMFLGESDKLELSRYNEKDGLILWQFSISNFPLYKDIYNREQQPEIRQIIGVYNAILWVFVSEYHLLGIDVETGRLVHHIENVPDFLGLDKEEKRHISLGHIHLNESEGILKVFAHRFYFEIDLNNLQGNVKKDFGEIWKDNWRIKNSTYYQEYPNLLFFSGYYKNMDAPNAFGIFDAEKAEIIWYDTTKDGLGYFFNPPQANDKLLAVLDDKGNLLVYER